MSAVIPPNPNEVYRGMSGYKKNLLRFYPDRSGDVNAQDTLRWTLPKEIMLMDTQMHYFEFSSKSTQIGASSTRQGFFFPRNSASIIDTITVFINGQVFENNSSYNYLFNLIYYNTCGHAFYQSGIRALGCADPSIRYTLTTAGTREERTAAAQGSIANGANDSNVCDTNRPLQFRNWIGFLGTCNRVLDLTNVEVVIEIRYAPATISFKGINATAPVTEITPAYTINNYFMTVFKVSFDDYYYQMALNSLKASGNYSITFKTYSNARSAKTYRSNNPISQFSTTAKWLSKLYFTFMQPNFDTPTYLLNQGTSSNVATPSFSQLQSNFLTNIIGFNQSRYFQKNGLGLTEAQIEINGIPVYLFHQTPALIKNNNLAALDLGGNTDASDYTGLQSLDQWTITGFLHACSFEHCDAWKNGIISGYPNPTSNLLNIKYSTTLYSNNTNDLYILAFAERVVKAIFLGSAVSIEYQKKDRIFFLIKTSNNS
jgi:hypothetical protein